MFRCARLIIPVFIGKTKGNAVRQFDNIDFSVPKPPEGRDVQPDMI